jgi:hypothetical protein
MDSTYFAGLEPTSSRELSRRAAERYAVLTAVEERRSQERRSAQLTRSGQPVPHLVAIGTGATSGGCA